MKTGIYAIIKNEQDYLKEWIDWHLSLGFDSILLCEDIESAPHDSIVNMYPNVRLIRYKDSICSTDTKEYGGRQMKFYFWCARTNPLDCDWAAFIDLDEFIHLTEKDNISDFLAEYAGNKAVYLYWKHYNANGHVTKPKGNVQDNYTVECKPPEKNRGWRFKSIVNMRDNPTILSPHEADGGINTLGIGTKRILCYHKAFIKHYFTKSWEDWVIRFIQRGDVCPNNRKIEQFFECNPDMLPMKEELIGHLEETTKRLKAKYSDVTNLTSEQIEKIRTATLKE